MTALKICIWRPRGARCSGLWQRRWKMSVPPRLLPPLWHRLLWLMSTSFEKLGRIGDIVGLIVYWKRYLSWLASRLQHYKCVSIATKYSIEERSKEWETPRLTPSTVFSRFSLQSVIAAARIPHPIACYIRWRSLDFFLCLCSLVSTH